MFYKLMYTRGLKRYRKSYINILILFSVCMMMFSFINIYTDSYLYYDYAVSYPRITANHTCDIRITNADESQARLFSHIPDVRIEYKNGNLDFYVDKKENVDTVYNSIHAVYSEILKEFRRTHIGDVEDIFPSLYKYYGEKITDYLVDYHESRAAARITAYSFLALLAVPGIASMILIYSSYIDERTDDIRTLSAIGISQKQLHKLFFTECNVLYAISAVVGFILGTLSAFLFFLLSKNIDTDTSNAVFPVFHIDPLSLILIAAVGYLAVYITFSIGLKKILKTDASYTCGDTVIDFDTDKSRGLYYTVGIGFVRFFTSVLRKRSPKQFTVQTVLVIFSLIVSVFMLNVLNYDFVTGYIDFGASLSTFSESVANGSLYCMSCIFAAIFSFAVIHLFTKLHAQSFSKTVTIMCALGADKNSIYESFKRYTIQKMITAVVSGFVLGYAVTVFAFIFGEVPFYINFAYILGNILIAAVYSLAYVTGIKKYYRPCCCDTLSLREED